MPRFKTGLAVALVVTVAMLLLLGPLQPTVVTVVPVPAPRVSYSEQTVDLPGFNPLYGYVYGNNCVPSSTGCFSNGADYSQIPVLSSGPEQPLGIYYVSNDSELAEYSLTNGSVRSIAHVTLLYQNYSHYAGMIANEFFLSYGYDEALFFGMLNRSFNSVAVETVNLTTGLVEMDNTSIGPAAENQQALLIATGMVLVISTAPDCEHVTCAATAVTINMTTGAERTAIDDLPFFEANNIYWMPQKKELINIEAHGAATDLVEQWNETDGTFVLATTVRVDTSAVTINWVNGISYDPTTQQIAYSAGGGGYAATYVLSYASNGTLTARGEVKYVSTNLSRAVTPQVFNGQQYVYTGDWMMGGFFKGTQYLFDPWNGTTIPTNEPFTNLSGFNVCDGSCFLGTYAPSPTYAIDFHATVARNDPFWDVVLAETNVFG